MTPKDTVLIVSPTTPPIPRLLITRIMDAARIISRMISVWNPLDTLFFFAVFFLPDDVPLDVVLAVPFLLL